MKTLIVILVVIALGAIIYLSTRKKSSKKLPHNSGYNNNANHQNR